MSETRRLKIKIGDAEFEADVPESNVQPMYDRFLSILEGRRASIFRRISTTDGKRSDNYKSSNEEVGRDTSVCVGREISAPDGPLLRRAFHLSSDNLVILKVLPNGSAQHADALLLLLYGYRQLKSEPVSAVELNRAAEQSGISLRRLSNGYAKNHRYLVRGGYGKGSHYRLNSEGLAIAKGIMAMILEHTESATPQISNNADLFQESAPPVPL